eukprot:6221861-Pyramimonas_sp.AAC.1
MRHHDGHDGGIPTLLPRLSGLCDNAAGELGACYRGAGWVVASCPKRASSPLPSGHSSKLPSFQSSRLHAIHVA